MPSFDPEAIRTRLSWSRAELTEGLTDDEFREIELRFGFRFGADHRELLACALPIGRSWPDWRHGSDEQLRSMLDWPVEGILFDVENNGFWAPSWGPRPTEPADALAFAAARLGQVPRLIPVAGHRYLPADVAETGYPVFSVYQCDVVYYGGNLLDYLEQEFAPSSTPRHLAEVQRRVRFWSLLAEDRRDEL